MHEARDSGAVLCHHFLMTTILERGIKAAKSLPIHRQDEVGEILLAIAEQEASSLRLSSEQQAEEVRRRMASPPKLVPEAEMDAFFHKIHG